MASKINQSSSSLRSCRSCRESNNIFQKPSRSFFQLESLTNALGKMREASASSNATNISLTCSKPLAV